MARTDTRRSPLTLRRRSALSAEAQPLARADDRTALVRGGAAGAEPQPSPRRVPRFSSFWKALIITSFIMNAVLLLVVLLLVGFVFQWRDQLFGTTMAAQGFARDNVAELRSVVDGLAAATIETTIPLDTVTIPLTLNVPVDQQTVVTLVEPVPITLANADIDLGNGNRLRANAINLTLPQGTPLNIRLNMTIPIQQDLPLKDKGVTVPVSIPLKDTELNEPFQKLRNIVYRLAGPAGPLLGIDIPPVEPAPRTTPVPATP
jgi:hypothetical protein